MNISFSPFLWSKLLDWYSISGRSHLPWRDYTITDDSVRVYHIWLAEILLQQTQSERVVPYFTKIIETFPTIHDLANTSYESFFPYYQGLGYYSRARNLLHTAKIIHQKYNNIFPKDLATLLQLPGIGAYTARAILAFGYNIPYLAWDTNLQKVFARFYFGTSDTKISHTEKQYIESSFQDFLQSSNHPLANARNSNNACMDFAALIDSKPPSTIDWDHYPITDGCWYKTRGKLEKIKSKKNSTFPTPDASILIILHQSHKLYFSSQPTTYTPFLIPPPLHRNTRSTVQQYFRTTYHLETSVRPIQKKWLSKSGKPFVLVYAQIQIGTPNFSALPLSLATAKQQTLDYADTL